MAVFSRVNAPWRADRLALSKSAVPDLVSFFLTSGPATPLLRVQGHSDSTQRRMHALLLIVVYRGHKWCVAPRALVKLNEGQYMLVFEDMYLHSFSGKSRPFPRRFSQRVDHLAIRKNAVITVQDVNRVEKRSGAKRRMKYRVNHVLWR